MIVHRSEWEQAAARLKAGEASLVALWGEAGYAHMALLDQNEIHRVSIACDGGRYPSVGKLHAPAIRLERAMRDLHALEPEGLPDTRQWLHHDEPYRFGRRPNTRAPYPFTERQYARLLILRSRLNAVDSIDDRAAA